VEIPGEMTKGLGVAGLHGFTTCCGVLIVEIPGGMTIL
jgi:hypothetical protein